MSDKSVVLRQRPPRRIPPDPSQNSDAPPAAVQVVTRLPEPEQAYKGTPIPSRAGSSVNPSRDDLPRPVDADEPSHEARHRSEAPAVVPPNPRWRDYEVGKGKPPVHSRFKKGQIANPHGRPKGSKNLKTLLLEALNTKVTVREGGKTKRISKGALGIHRLVHKFMETGDVSYLRAFAAFLPDMVAASSENGPPQSSSPVEKAQRAALLEFYEGIIRSGGSLFDGSELPDAPSAKSKNNPEGGRK